MNRILKILLILIGIVMTLTGLFLYFENGLILDYGTAQDNLVNHVAEWHQLGVWLVIIGFVLFLGPILVALVKRRNK